MFDAKAFMDASVKAPLSTSIEVCPEGTFPFIIDTDENAVSFRAGEKDGRQWIRGEIVCVCQDEKVKADLGRDRITARFGGFIDIDEKTGALDISKGKNVWVGQLREAVGQNNDKAWNWNMLKGAGPFLGVVKQTEDPNDPSRKYANITRVAKK